MKLIEKIDPSRWSEYHAHGDEFHVIHKEDTSFLEDHIKKLRADRVDNGIGRLQAKLPLTVWTDLQRRGITSDANEFRRWLNHPDNRVWRVSGGKL